MRTTYIILVFIALLGCKKNNEPQLPPITTTGANTFGCLVNGEVFEANRGGFFSHAIEGFLTDTSIGVVAHGELGHIYIKYSSEQIEQTTYVLDRDDYCYGKFGHPTKGIFVTNSIFNGELHVLKIDTIEQFVSGTFWFDAVNTENEVIEIREGRFDANYYL